jgi:hypothetical protein
MAWGVGNEEDAREKRLALLLADGTGDFDFVRARAILNWVVLEGHVAKYQDKERAEELARYVGFTAIVNTIRVYPANSPDDCQPSARTSKPSQEQDDDARA